MENRNRPYVLEETNDYAVVFKPPKMHSAPLSKKEGAEETLLEWYASQSSSAEKLSSAVDLMHRLDYETHGLILIAKTQKSFEHFKTLQDEGGFVKEYSAVCKNKLSLNASPENCVCAEADGSEKTSAGLTLPDGYPPPPAINREPSIEKPLVIMSYFRPFGPGRKLVRPVLDTAKKNKEIATDKGGFYRTEIISSDANVFTVRIKRGFRHQIRCHLCWIGCPILNDLLYNSEAQNSEDPLEAGSHEASQLALRAHALFFTDPATGEPMECRIAALST